MVPENHETQFIIGSLGPKPGLSFQSLLRLASLGIALILLCVTMGFWFNQFSSQIFPPAPYYGLHVFVPTISGTLLALKANDGTIAWQTKPQAIAGSPAHISSSIVADEEIITEAMSAEGTIAITAFDVASSKQRWQAPASLSFAHDTSDTLADGILLTKQGCTGGRPMHASPRRLFAPDRAVSSPSSHPSVTPGRNGRCAMAQIYSPRPRPFSDGWHARDRTRSSRAGDACGR